MDEILIESIKIENNIIIEIFAQKANKSNIKDWIKYKYQKELIEKLIKYNENNKCDIEFSKKEIKIIWHISVIYALSQMRKNYYFFFIKARIKENKEITNNNIFLGLVSFAINYYPIFCKKIKCCSFFDMLEYINNSAFIWYVAKTKEFEEIREIKKILNENIDYFSLIEKFVIKNWNVELIWLHAFFKSLKKVYNNKGFCNIDFLDCKYHRLSWWRKIDDKYMCKIVNNEIA
jgi:hypothetical protein